MLELPSDKCFVIAEAGTNHAVIGNRGVFDGAFNYIEAAAKSRADAIKFQWFNIDEELFCPLPGDEWRKHRWLRSWMPIDQWYDVKRYAENHDLVFLSSTFQHSTVQWLNDLKVVATKVASRAAENFPYDKAPKPYLISTGMMEGEYPHFRDGMILLQCEAKYPSTMLWRGVNDSHVWPRFEGFSDHSGTPWRAIDAISRGCRIVEVHFHIDERDAGPDLPASLTVDQLKLVCEARDAFASLRQDRGK